MEDTFDERESLKLISEMIGKAKSSYITTGAASIVWGILIIICSLLTWGQLYFNQFFNFDVWLLVFIAVIFQIYFSIKEKKQRKFVAHDEQVMTYVWSTFGICIFIFSFYNSKFGSFEHSANSIFLLLYGIPTFITGGVYKFKPMIIGGLVCWVLCIVSMFTNAATDMLFMAASGLFAWLIPGVILWKRYKQLQKTNV
jgi:hypothetical protein